MDSLAGTRVAKINQEDEFEPGADPKQWIEQHAGPYRERPIAVLRELLQNAADILRNWEGELRFIEVAILNRAAELELGSYHLVIRDSGAGMTEEQFRKEIGVLGVSTKRGDITAIGEFGVGFYSTHAICRDVAILSKTASSRQLTAWKYAPDRKLFSRLDELTTNALLGSDYERHPQSTRRRASGTSVYLNLDVREYSVCEEWLQGSSLAAKVRLDCILLPARLFVADYASDPTGAAIRDFHKRDVRDMSLSLERAPWEAEGLQKKTTIADWFSSRLPYTPPTDQPKEFFSFHRQVGDGSVSGFLYLYEGRYSHLEVFLKRMRVELAPDLKPVYLSRMFGCVDLSPGSTTFQVKVLSARDHILRNSAFQAARVAVEDSCIDFCFQLGQQLESDIAEVVAANSGAKSGLDIAVKALNKSRFHEMLCDIREGYDRLFLDIPSAFHDIVGEQECPTEIRDAVLRFVQRHAPPDTVVLGTLLPALKMLQESADREYIRSESGGTPQPLEWNPRVSRSFFEKIGPFLPFRVHYKEVLKGGEFQVRLADMPISSLRLIDAGSTSPVRVLVRGRSDDYFSRNPAVKTLVVPKDDSAILALALLRRFHPEDFRLEFVSFKKPLFTELATKEEWEPLIELFRNIVVGQHTTGTNNSELKVEAMGYLSNLPPLLIHTAHDTKVLVINGYNVLAKDIRETYSQALRTNNLETKDLLGRMCHELYHHAQPAELEGTGEDLHVLETRAVLFLNMLRILQRYHDLAR